MEDDRSQDGPLHVVCMVGPGRSGSTVLAELLATASGGAFVGELLHLGGRTETRSCSCGARLIECPFWNGVSSECGLPLPELGRKLAAAKLATRTRPLPYLRAYLGGPDEELTALLRRVLAAACGVAGTRVAVESSKAPALLPALHGAADRTSAVLVQRATDQVRRSYQKAREFSIRAGRDGYYRRTPPWSVPALVGAKSALSIAMARRLGVELEQLRLQDVLVDPRARVVEILQRFGLPHDHADRIRPDGFHKADLHSVGGNSKRHRRGFVPFEA